ncbi:hypothetical protein I6N95_05110 [Vagococcus sp. BWB3-3]|uniref:Uncharacterized protein n=1 Tax=Vagococcus allomyrinae TaxID=2794353 RepID=A0A940P8H9_9ENTE|nr:hypothetical protein [Vagococcus allomyrinae]MBP1040389.1 hypothetical protein [Vagococcus allomyrinae]
MNEVSVKTFFQISGKELEAMIQEHLNRGFYIQDSSISMYQMKLEGVYIFVKAIEEKPCSIGIDFGEELRKGNLGIS